MTKKSKIILAVILVILVAPVVIPLVGIFIFPNLPGHELLIRYLSAISKWSLWPFATIVLFIILCVFFHREISKKIATISFIDLLKRKVAWPEDQPQQPQPPAAAETKVVPSAAVKLEVATTRVKELEREIYLGRIIRVMYRSQFDFLLEISRLGSIHMQTLVAWYMSRFRGNKSIITIDQYTGYLFKSGLIETKMTDIDKPTIILTPLGHEFIEFAKGWPIAFLYPF